MAAIALDRTGPVAVLRLQQGKVNALDLGLLAELTAAVGDLAGAGAPPVVVTGEGRAFSAGVDLTAFLEGGPAYAEALVPALSAAFEAVFTYPGPTVAAVNGAAIAGGCILAAACDRRLLAAGARIGATELAVGVAFPAAALEVLRHACAGHLETVVLGASLYEGEAAVAVGLADEVVDPVALLARAEEAASALGALAPEPYRLAKEQIRRPAVERMAADAGLLDLRVRARWAAEETLAAVRAALGGAR